jgi:hypothetical protein
MYHAYGDFSGVMGVIARKLKYNYASNGFYKIYVDKKNTNHYILISDSLYDGLIILGYENVISKYSSIQSNQDIVDFLSSSYLFDSAHFKNSDLNRGDRKKIRIGRKSARFIRDSLVNLNKNRSQLDDDFYFKQRFPELYEKYLNEVKKIEEFVPYKSKYNGNWIMEKFNVSPGPIVGKIQKKWIEQYGESIDSVNENDLYEFTKRFMEDFQIKSH